MENNLLITVIVLSIIIFLLILYVIVIQLQTEKRIKSSNKKAVDDFFELMLKGGFDQKVEEFQILNKHFLNDDPIVFIGDSLTQNYNIYEFFKDKNVYNRGIGGDTTIGLKNRLNESVFNLNPSKIFLLIGTNDFGLIKDTTPLILKERIKEIISLIHNKLPNTKIYLESLYPVNESNDPKIDQLSVGSRTNTLIKETNELLKELDNVTYIDLYSTLIDESNNLKLDLTIEGLHLNTKGYEEVTKILNKYL